jgi:hypothetical protein
MSLVMLILYNRVLLRGGGGRRSDAASLGSRVDRDGKMGGKINILNEISWFCDFNSY